MVTKILGRREESLSIKTWSLTIPRGRLTKVDIETRVYKLFQELDLDKDQSDKGLAYKYLHKVLDVLEEYSN